MKRYGKIFLAALFALILALGNGAALAEESSRTIVLRDPVFQLDGEDVLALDGLSFTLSQLSGGEYLRLEAGDARLAMGMGRQDGQILLFMDGLDGLYALPTDEALASWDVRSLSSAQFWQDLLDGWMAALQTGTAEDVEVEILGETRPARQYAVSMSGPELEELLAELLPSELPALSGAAGTLAVSDDNAFALHLALESGLSLNAEGLRGETDSTFHLAASQAGEEVGSVSLGIQGGDMSLEATWQDAQLSAEIRDVSGTQTAQLSAASGGMSLSATGLRTGEAAQWRAVLSGADGADAFRLEALYDAQISPLEGGGTHEAGTFSLNAEDFSVSFDLEASTVPTEGTAGFFDGMDMPVIRVDEMTEAEQMALGARVQSLFLNFAAGAIQNVPGLTDFATMLASSFGDSLPAQGVLSALMEAEEQGFEENLPTINTICAARGNPTPGGAV
ncbi:MAG TPA: hypothetical protein IAA84_04355 [Candidatus Alectryocaccomicrobium excrementavium]|uniref:Uncharacterized protein n=1 Tax=Candidatus Alectryocaccomicrobium excrementavium TaxID=2840668 RepID=A0A9D1K5D9_9FIRM|nr:hypothetical protein [Candidatus Alectryocaccomicrobium excrementavium]